MEVLKIALLLAFVALLQPCLSFASNERFFYIESTMIPIEYIRTTTDIDNRLYRSSAKIKNSEGLIQNLTSNVITAEVGPAIVKDDNKTTVSVLMSKLGNISMEVKEFSVDGNVKNMSFDTYLDDLKNGGETLKNLTDDNTTTTTTTIGLFNATEQQLYTAGDEKPVTVAGGGGGSGGDDNANRTKLSDENDEDDDANDVVSSTTKIAIAARGGDIRPTPEIVNHASWADGIYQKLGMILTGFVFILFVLIGLMAKQSKMMKYLRRFSSSSSSDNGLKQDGGTLNNNGNGSNADGASCADYSFDKDCDTTPLERSLLLPLKMKRVDRSFAMKTF